MKFLPAPVEVKTLGAIKPKGEVPPSSSRSQNTWRTNRRVKFLPAPVEVKTLDDQTEGRSSSLLQSKSKHLAIKPKGEVPPCSSRSQKTWRSNRRVKFRPAPIKVKSLDDQTEGRSSSLLQSKSKHLTIKPKGEVPPCSSRSQKTWRSNRRVKFRPAPVEVKRLDDQTEGRSSSLLESKSKDLTIKPKGEVPPCSNRSQIT